MWEESILEHQIRGWRAVFAARLQGEGSCERSVYFACAHTGVTTLDNVPESERDKWGQH